MGKKYHVELIRTVEEVLNNIHKGRRGAVGCTYNS